MRYPRITNDPETGEGKAFSTNWYDRENNYRAEHQLLVIDTWCGEITFDGENWQEIEEDP